MTQERDGLLTEQAVLASILIGEPLVYKRAASLLEGQEFCDSRNQEIWKVMQLLASEGKAIDLLSLSSAVEALSKNEATGGIAYISSILDVGPDPDNVETYCRHLQEAHKKQLLSLTLDQMKIALTSGRASDDVIGVLKRRVQEIVKKDADRHLITADALVSLNDKAIQRALSNRGTLPGLSTGFDQLDMFLCGLQKTDLIILAARPSVGKSAMAVCMAHSILSRGKGVFFASLEMSASQVGLRFRCVESGVELQKIRMGYINQQDQEALSDSAEQMKRWRLWVDDTPRLTADEVLTRASKVAYSSGLDAIFVDYIQLMGSKRSGDNRVREVSLFASDLKAAAKELDVPVIALAQLSRRVEQRGDGDNEPVLSDLKESGGLEEAADVVLALHRPSDEEVRETLCEVLILKQRNGPTGKVTLGWHGPTARFTPLVQVTG